MAYRRILSRAYLHRHWLQSAALKTVDSASVGPLAVDGDFTRPAVKTPVPGPMSKTLIQEIGRHMQVQHIVFFTDYEHSRGNYVVDADGNIFLDLFTQIGSLPLGYNHPSIQSAVLSEPNLASLVSRPALGVHPPTSWSNLVCNTLLPLAPPGLTEVTPMMCGTCSNENAFKAAFIAYMGRLRDKPISELSEDCEEFRSTMLNQPPGTPKISVLSFKGGFHGRALGTLSCTHSKPIHKLDIPAFDWPAAPFPQLRYPLNEFERENREEEKRCLEEVEDQIERATRNEQPVAAIIVEPIQAEGGDKHASANFFRELRAIAQKHNVALIVDEVQTGGGATGLQWAHEYWGLPEPPDIVTFAKKMLTGGFFHSKAMTPKEGYRIFNTWMGDPIRVVMLKAVAEEVRKNNLLELVRTSGNVLLSGLLELERLYPSLIHSARGVGTFCAIDCPTARDRDNLLLHLRHRGFHLGGSGVQTIRFRPSLLFQPHHVNLFLTGFEDTLKELNEKK